MQTLKSYLLWSVIVTITLFSCSKNNSVIPTTSKPGTDTTDTVVVVDSVKPDPMQAILGVYEGWHQHMEFMISGGDTNFYLNENTESRAIVNKGSTKQNFTFSLYVKKNGNYVFNWDGGMYNYVDGETNFPIEEQGYGKPRVSIIFTDDSVKYSYLYYWAAHNIGQYHYETINGGWKKVK